MPFKTISVFSSNFLLESNFNLELFFHLCENQFNFSYATQKEASQRCLRCWQSELKCLKCLSARSDEEDMDGSFKAKGTPSPLDLLRLILYFINFPFFCCLSPTCLLSFSSSSLSPLTSSSTFLSFFQNSVFYFFLLIHFVCVCVCEREGELHSAVVLH